MSNKNHLSQKILNYLAYLDFFSSKATFKFQNKDYYSTILGGLISILFIITCVIFTFANQSLWKNNLLFSSKDQSRQQNQYYLNTTDLNLSVSIVNQKQNNVFNNMSISFYCKDFEKPDLIALNTSKECLNGQYCLAPQQHCPFYFHQNYNYDSIIILVKACNPKLNPSCNMSTFNNLFNNSVYTVMIKFNQWTIDTKNKKFKNSAGNKNISFKISKQINNFNLPIKKIQYHQQYTIFPSILSYNFTETKFYYDQSNKAIKYSQNKQLDNYILCKISLVPEGTLININYQPADYIQIIIYFTSFLGTLVFIFSFCIPNYTMNCLYWQIANHLKYCVNKNYKIMDADKFSLSMTLVNLLYFKPFESIWQALCDEFKLDNIKKRLLLIKIGDKSLNISNLLTKLIQLSKNNKITRQNVRLGFEAKEEVQYQMQEQIKKTEQYMKTMNNIESNQSRAFLKLIKVNKFTFQESQVLYNMLFPAKYKLFQFNLNPAITRIFQEFQYFLQIQEKISQKKSMTDVFRVTVNETSQIDKQIKNTLEMSRKDDLRSIRQQSSLDLFPKSSTKRKLSLQNTEVLSSDRQQMPVKKLVRSKFAKNGTNGTNKRLIKREISNQVLKQQYMMEQIEI